MNATIQQLLQKANGQIDQLDAELILAHVINKPREFVVAHSETKIERLKDQKIKRLIKKRKAGVPLAYLTGHKEFYGLDFLVNKNTLIPRPDTETIISLTLDTIKDWKVKRLKDCVLIDVGTGTGCIPIAILKTLQHINTSTHKHINTYAIDKSVKALNVARKNAKKHHVKIKFLHGNLLSPLSSSLFPLSSPIIITANLPYLSNAQYLANPDLKHEPKSALIAKNNGLALYEELLKQLANNLSIFQSFNLQFTLFLEIDPSQSQAIIPLIKQYLSTAKIEIKKDLGARDRVVVINLL